jgi:transposase-like protein
MIILMSLNGSRPHLLSKGTRSMNQTEPTKTEGPAPRRYHSPADKVRILRLHLLKGRAISEICRVRLHSALGYITPADRIAARHTAIFAAIDKQLEAARENRKTKRQQQTRLVA